MTLDEFQALKQRLIERAEFALDRTGSKPMPGHSLKVALIGPLSIARHNGLLKLALHFSVGLGGSQTVYESYNDVETQLRWSHDYLVERYDECLALIDRHMLLEDLSSV